MNTAVENVTDTRKTLVVSVPAAAIAAAEQSVVKDYLRHARLPGFRPGKAPLDMVRRRFAREIDAEVQRKLAQESYEFAVKESKLNIYAFVGSEGGPFAAGSDATVKYTVDVLAEFAVPPYAGIPVTAPETAVTDADVEGTLQQLREQRADYVVVQRPAAKGDFVKLNYTGTLDGRPVAELVPDRTILGTQHDTWEEAGAEHAPGVRAVIDGVIGLAAGDKKEVTQTFPADFEAPALAGKTAAYALEVLEVREKRPAALDDAFAKGMQAENVEQLRARVREEIATRKAAQARASTREQLARALTGAVDFPLPESALENETQAILAEHMQRHMERGVPEEEFEKHKEQLHASARQAAAARVKLTLILLKVAEAEKIKVEDKDLHERIMQEAVVTRQRPEAIVKRLQEDRGLLAQMQRAILHTKTLDFLATQAKFAPAPAPA